jgi:hypothetical protein
MLLTMFFFSVSKLIMVKSVFDDSRDKFHACFKKFKGIDLV